MWKVQTWLLSVCHFLSLSRLHTSPRSTFSCVHRWKPPLWLGASFPAHPLQFDNNQRHDIWTSLLCQHIPDEQFCVCPHQFNVLTAILSWVNLDFQLMQCLYNGLNSCTKSWLEFVFPVYLWTIVVAIVLLSRRFSRIALLFAGNTVQVLATLIELSYAGLARAVVTALSPIWITVHSSNHTTYSVRWLYDGNIQYLELKHVPIFLVGSIFGILILAHTLILLFVQPLQHHSNLCCLSWVAKLKPLIDAYTSPHLIKDQCRYWPGLLLLVRLLLILVFALNATGKAGVILTAIVTSCLLILTVAWSVGGVYKKAYLNSLNSFFIINLGMLSLLTIQYRSITITYVSASLAACCCHVWCAAVPCAPEVEGAVQEMEI